MSVAALRIELSSVAEADQVEPMEAYMRDQFPFLGVKAGPRRTVQRPYIASFKGATGPQLLAAAEGLWAQPEREFAYCATDLLRKWERSLTPAELSGLRDLIVTKSWWDTVDQLAANIVGRLVFRHRELLTEMDQWINDPDLWVARTAILCQLTWGAETDRDRLAVYCVAQAGHHDFFIRKAIGWALRQYARTDPTWVRGFVDAHPELSGLTKREALKHLDR